MASGSGTDAPEEYDDLPPGWVQDGQLAHPTMESPTYPVARQSVRRGDLRRRKDAPTTIEQAQSRYQDRLLHAPQLRRMVNGLRDPRRFGRQLAAWKRLRSRDPATLTDEQRLFIDHVERTVWDAIDQAIPDLCPRGVPGLVCGQYLLDALLPGVERKEVPPGSPVQMGVNVSDAVAWVPIYPGETYQIFTDATTAERDAFDELVRYAQHFILEYDDQCGPPRARSAVDKLGIGLARALDPDEPAQSILKRHDVEYNSAAHAREIVDDAYRYADEVYRLHNGPDWAEVERRRHEETAQALAGGDDASVCALGEGGSD